MSSTNLCPNVTYHVKVLVRAYGDEPVVLKAVDGNAKTIEVVGEDESISLSYPAGYVYEFETDLFEKLNSAYRNQDHLYLQKLWKDAKQYKWK